MSGEVLWTPDEARIADANVTRFRKEIERGARRRARRFGGAARVVRWRTARRSGARSGRSPRCAGTPGERVLVDDAMPGARWFPDARAERRGEPAPARRRRLPPSCSAVRAARTARRASSRTRSSPGRWPASPRTCGPRAVGLVGDRVAGFLPNVPEAVVAMLAATAIGATWSSCSPDFGIDGVHDRFGQIAPKVLFAANGYRYAGRVHDVSGTVEALVERTRHEHRGRLVGRRRHRHRHRRRVPGRRRSRGIGGEGGNELLAAVPPRRRAVRR